MTRLTAVCFALSLFAGSALANDMADAKAAFDANQFPKALQIYTRLADAGDALAQVRLGEMYWYGEAGTVDVAKASSLFAKAAATGLPAALAAQNMLAQHDARKADIAWWTSGYDGADLTAGEYSCARPVIPSVSETRKDVLTVSGKYETWSRCYNEIFVPHLNDNLPAGKRIPADIAFLMNGNEYLAAVAHLDKVYARVGAEQAALATATVDRYLAWQKGTEQFVSVAQMRSRAYAANQSSLIFQSNVLNSAPQERAHSTSSTGR